MASRVPAGGQAAALAPAGVGLALFVVVVEFRMDASWADGVLFLVAAVAAVALLALGLAAAEGDDASQPAMTALLVAGLLLAGIAIARLGNLLGVTTSPPPAGRSRGCWPCSRRWRRSARSGPVPRRAC